MNHIELHVVPDLHDTGNPDAWMVYGQSAKGGCCITLFNGTERECREHVKSHRAELLTKARGLL